MKKHRKKYPQKKKKENATMLIELKVPGGEFALGFPRKLKLFPFLRK